MVIDKIGSLNNIVEPKKSSPASTAKTARKNDSVQISSEGKKAAETAKVAQAVKAAPDIRIDRVRELKQLIESGAYNFDKPEILETVADKIASALARK
jgi:negative regulator of flagellin synthesis FlgM